MKTVLCLGASRLYAEGAAALLERIGAGAIRAIALTALDARSLDEPADLLLLDLPVSAGHPLVKRFRAAHPEAKVMPLVDPTAEEEVLEYARAGVSGYFTRNRPPAQIVGQLLGDTPHPNDPIAAILLRQVAYGVASEPRSGAICLTHREKQVLGLIERGLSNKEIANALCLELATVKNHVHRILSKTNSRRRTQAARVLRSHPAPGEV